MPVAVGIGLPYGGLLRLRLSRHKKPHQPGRGEIRGDK